MVTYNLSDEIQQHVKVAGKSIASVVVEEGVPCSVGLFHLKIRHLEDFVDYFLRKENTSYEDAISAYVCSKKEMAKGKMGAFEKLLREYDRLARDFNIIYNATERRFPLSKRRIMRAVVRSKDSRQFKTLKHLYEDQEEYAKRCDAMWQIAKEMAEMEKANLGFFAVLNGDIKLSVGPVITGPDEIYHDEKENVLNFCSGADDKNWVLSLIIDEQHPGTAALLTGFQLNKERLASMRRIYAK